MATRELGNGSRGCTNDEGILGMNVRTTHAELAQLEFSAAADSSSVVPSGLIGVSEFARRLRAKANALAAAELACVVVSGPPGSGRHHLARWLHRQSKSTPGPIGFVDAADSGAAAQAERHLGADASTLVIENVEHASPPLLAALLQLVTKFDAGQSQHRVALLTRQTTAHLRESSLTFDQLLGRSSAAILELPALRDRADDIQALAQHFAARSVRRHGRSIRGVSPQALARLCTHDYPGNLAELEALLECAVSRCTGDWIGVDDIPLPSDRAPADGPAHLVIRMPGSSLRDIELQAIRLALRIADGRLVRAADLLGVTRHALRRKLEKYGLQDLRTAPRSEPTPPDEGFI